MNEGPPRGHKQKNSQKQNNTKQKHRQSSDLQPRKGVRGRDQGGESYPNFHDFI